MIHWNAKLTCDREVGSPKKGWRVCGRPAVVEVKSRGVTGFYFLRYCAVHAPKKTVPEVRP